MDLKEDIEKQINAGFQREEIYSNCIAKGFAKEEIDRTFSQVAVSPEIVNRQSGGSTKSILFGILFLVVAIVRISRASNSHGTITTFLWIGAISAIVLAIIHFARPRA